MSVKSGHVKPGDIRDLKGTVNRERAGVGVLVTLEEPSAEMRLEATSAGAYQPGIDRIQILTIADALKDIRPQLPVLQQQELFDTIPDTTGPSVSDLMAQLDADIERARRARRSRELTRLEDVRSTMRTVLESAGGYGSPEPEFATEELSRNRQRVG